MTNAALRSESALRIPPSVNFHLWEPCNMRCRYCFATFQDVKQSILPKGHLPKELAIELVHQLAPVFKKLSFAGGEPMLCPWLSELIAIAKSKGLITMLVTNGSRLSLDWLNDHRHSLDWLTLSIDSALDSTHVQLGRAEKGRAMPAEQAVRMANACRELGIRFKVNTVVTSLNAHEDMNDLMLALKPERWKVFQVLSVKGQNSGSVEPLLCSSQAFQGFIKRHQCVSRSGIELVAEDNTLMRGSYAMIDPAGRFFDDTQIELGHTYSGPILELGVERAFRQISFSLSRFAARGGNYNF